MAYTDILALILALEAVDSDLKSGHIENAWILTGTVLSAGLRISLEGMEGLFRFGIGALVLFVVLYFLFWIRAMGAGDIKLLCVFGGLYGLSRGFSCFACAVFCGAVLSVCQLVFFTAFRERIRYFVQYMAGWLKSGIRQPYMQKGEGVEKLHFSVPILMAVLLGIGGVY